ncbi:pumilio-family RNA binding repeat domain-containing protein [Apiospora kogelbergensis]|uniref:Nucleolar protein 9 n=1 Tax=Apiospora kogelbergensis TaxID=1337665 RepID=A0AAW0QD22_9PEZI
MPKPRSKRQAIREERKSKRQERDDENAEAEERQAAKRQRIDEAGNANAEFQESGENGAGQGFEQGGHEQPEKEFFGMLTDEEQEYFRSVDEVLDVDEFPSQEDRDIYLNNVFIEAQGKELKLACSQSCSRLLERLILMSNTRQKKKLFEQFATHFLNLLQHRFASHCCETLFLQSAPIVTRELTGERDDAPIETEDQPLPLMEELFLLSLDELEGHFSYLLTDRFASHSIRVLLMILSGRPLEESSTKTLIHSRRKEKISVPWMSSNTVDDKDSTNAQARPVPSVFTLAAKKIINDSTAGMNETALRVLATHPTGNPVLQLLLELDIALNPKSDKEGGEMTLLWRLLPGAPNSLKEEKSPANDFVNAMLYDPVGSRLLETLVTHCPGKVFKAMWKTNLGPRIQSLVRNDIASYPAIRMLNRVGKEELVAAMEKIFPEVPKLVSLSRFNVLKTLFERCQVREAKAETESLMKALISALGRDKKELVPKLCIPTPDENDGKKGQPSISKAQSVIASHGCHLTTTLLSIPGLPATSIQKSLHSLPHEVLLSLATSSAPTAHVLLAAFTSPSQDKVFHKALVAALLPHTLELAQSQHGSKVLSSIIYMPSKSEGIMLAFHLKEQIMTRLSQHEAELRETFEGRKVWRAWQGDMYKTRRVDWIAWAKEVDDQSGPAAEPIWKRKAVAEKEKAAPSKSAPRPKKLGKGDDADNPNSVNIEDGRRERKKKRMAAAAKAEDTEMS